MSGMNCKEERAKEAYPTVVAMPRSKVDYS
jgi:hypothetical protein